MKQYHLTWEELFSRLAQVDAEGFTIYGVPRGGMIAAGFLKHAKITHRPEEADIILDDIVDSGKTRERYKDSFPQARFIGLVDKTEDDQNIGWVVFPWEEADEKSAEDIVLRQLQFIGENASREGLQNTPARVLRSWKELFAGYGKDPAGVFTTFCDGSCDEMVLLKGIEFYSTCEHHLLPFFGKAHIAYLPNKKVIGVSKLARLLDIFARRAQIQERIGSQVTDALMQHLEPVGAACILEAQHMCMTSRGVQKQDSVMVTSSLRGAFKDKPEARAELLSLIRA